MIIINSFGGKYPERLIFLLFFLLFCPLNGQSETGAENSSFSNTGIYFEYSSDLSLTQEINSDFIMINLKGPEGISITMYISPHEIVINSLQKGIMAGIRGSFPNASKFSSITRQLSSRKLSGFVFSSGEPGFSTFYEFYSYALKNKYLFFYFDYSEYKKNEQNVLGYIDRIIDSFRETGTDLNSAYFIKQAQFNSNAAYKIDKLDHSIEGWTEKDEATNYIKACLLKSYYLHITNKNPAEILKSTQDLKIKFPAYSYFIYGLLGDISCWRHERAIAVSNYRLSILSKQTNPRVYRILGNLYGCTGDFGKAISNLQIAIKQNPDILGPYYDQAEIFEKSGDYSNARKCFDHAISLSSGGDGFARKAEFLRKIKRFDEAIENLKYAIRLSRGKTGSQSDIHYYGKLSDIYLETGDFDSALKVCQECIDKNSQSPAAYMLRGWAYLFLKQWEAAREDFEITLRYSPDDPAAHANLAIYFLKAKKNQKKAVKYYRNALKNGYDIKTIFDSSKDGYFLGDLLKDPEFKSLVDEYYKKRSNCDC